MTGRGRVRTRVRRAGTNWSPEKPQGTGEALGCVPGPQGRGVGVGAVSGCIRRHVAGRRNANKETREGGRGESLRPHPGGKSGLGPLPGQGRPASCFGSGSRTAPGVDRAAFPWGIPLPSIPPLCSHIYTPSPTLRPTHTHPGAQARLGRLRLEKKDRVPGWMEARAVSELQEKSGF